LQLFGPDGVIFSGLRKEFLMFIVLTVICLCLLLALAGADMLVENISSDELNNMGIEKKA